MAFAAALVALLAAFLFAAGWVLQQRIASTVTADGAKDPRFLTSLARQPLWWAGTAADTLGYVAQAVALGLGSLLLVQPLIVTSLLFALPLGAWWAGQRMPVSDWLWAGVLAVSLAVFVVVGNPSAGLDLVPFSEWRTLVVVLAAVVIVSIAVAVRSTGTLRALLLGVAVGVLFGATAALTKSVVSVLGDGLVALLTSWETWALAVTIAVGTYLQQVAFQAASLASSLPAATVLEPVVAAVIGVVVLEETLTVDGVHEVTIAVAVIAMAVATLVLSRSSGRRRAGGGQSTGLPAVTATRAPET